MDVVGECNSTHCMQRAKEMEQKEQESHILEAKREQYNVKFMKRFDFLLFFFLLKVKL